MIQKIKQNIVPIITFIMVIISAILVVWISRPANKIIASSDGITLSYHSGQYNMRTWTIAGKTGATSSANYMVNVPNRMYVTLSDDDAEALGLSSSITYSVYCIQPDTPNSSGSVTVGNTDEYTNGPIAWLACQGRFASGSEYANYQQAIRFRKLGRIPDLFKDSTTEFNAGDKDTVTSYYSSSAGQSVGARELGSVTRVQFDSPTISPKGTYQCIGSITNNSGVQAKIKSTYDYIKTDTKTYSDAKSRDAGTWYTLESGQTIYVWTSATTTGDIDFSIQAKDATSLTAYRIQCSGQDCVFGFPKFKRWKCSLRWYPQTTTVKVYKYVSGTQIPVKDVTFTLTYGAGTTKSARTNANGIATFTDIPIGVSYTIVESSVPNYITIDTSPETGTVKKNLIITRYNPPKKGKISFTKDFYYMAGYKFNGTFDPSGLVFTLTGTSDAGESVNLRFTYDGNYTFSVSDVPYGTYNIMESGVLKVGSAVVSSYSSQIVKSGVSVKSESVTNAGTIINLPSTGSVTLYKYAAYDSNGTQVTNDAVVGAQFEVYGTNVYGNAESILSFTGSNGSYSLAPSGQGNTTVVTGSDGRITLSGLPINSTVYFKEIAPPTGFKIINGGQSSPLVVGQTGTYTMYNQIGRGDLEFYKREYGTNKVISSAKFALKTPRGYVMVLSGSNGSYVASDSVLGSLSSSVSGAAQLSTDSNGYCRISNLPVGTYTIEEIGYPTNYVAAGSASLGGTIVLDSLTNFGTMYNTPDTGSILLSKNGPWNEYVASQEQYFTLVDENGYSVNLTKTAEGTYQYNGSSTTTVTQSNYSSHLTDGLTFTVNKNDGTAKISKLPLAYISNGQSVPTSYKVKELSTSANYNINTDDVTASLAKNPLITSFSNERKYGNFSLVKTDSYTEKLLPGAIYVLRSNVEDDTSFGNRYVHATKTNDGQYEFLKMSEVNASITEDCYIETSSNGALYIDNIPYGTYTLQEIKAPIYYATSEKTMNFTISDDNKSVQLNALTTKEEPIINYPLIGEFNFTKQGNIDNEAIADCVFAIQVLSSNVLPKSNVYLQMKKESDGVYSLDTIAYTDWLSTPNSSCEIRTDSTGHCTVKELPEGSYKVVELSVDNNGSYTLIDPDKPQSGISYDLNIFNESGNGGFKMVVSSDGNSVALETNETTTTAKTLTNYRKTASLKFYKKDSITHETNNLFTTCEFKLKLLDRNKYVVLTPGASPGEYTYKSVIGSVDKATSFNVNSQGVATFANLPIGTYEIYEISTDNDNLYKLTTTPVKVEVLDDSAEVSMENIPWGGKITFTKKTDHGTLYPNCDDECEFYVQVTEGDNKDQYVTFDLQDDGSYKFKGFVQSKSEATLFKTNISTTLNGQTENAKAILFDLPQNTYTIFEASTGANYDLALADPVTANVVLLRDNPDGEVLEMINYVLKSKTSLIKIMADDKVVINGRETDVPPTGFITTITGTSVTEATIDISLESLANGDFVVKKYNINNQNQANWIGKNEFELPIGSYTIAETNTGNHPTWGNHAHLDTIVQTNSDGTTKTLWDRIDDNGVESISYNCISSDAKKFKFTNILDNADLEVYKGVGAVRTDHAPEVVFIDTDVTYNISDFSNKMDTHNADLTIVDIPEANRDMDLLSLRKISIPGYNSIENGSDEIEFSIDVYDKTTGDIIFKVDRQPLTPGVYSTADLSPEIDDEIPSSSGVMSNIGKIVIKYYNFPARSGLIDDACINIRFRLSGSLEQFVTNEKNAYGKALFKTFNDVEFTHSFITDKATASADIQIKKVNIHKIKLNKTISPIVNGIDYSKTDYTFNPNYPDFKFEVSGMLINDNDEWEPYTNSYQVDTDQTVEIALPYGIFRLQELHANGYVDQIGYDVICDANGIYISPQNNSREYINLGSGTEVVGTPKLLNYKKFHIIPVDDIGVKFALGLDSTNPDSKPDGMTAAKVLSEKNYIKKVAFSVENELAVGTLHLDKITKVLGGDNAPQLAKNGYNVRIDGTSYAGISFSIELVSDKNGIFVPKTSVSGYDAANSTYQLPEGKYNITEYSLPEQVVLDNIEYNGETLWTRATDIEDSDTTDVTTSFVIIKDFANTGALTNVTNAKVYDEYEKTNLKFTKEFLHDGKPATERDFARLALDNLAEYNFRLTLTHESTGLQYNGLLSSKDGITFYNLPFGKYKVDESSEMYFDNIAFILNESSAHNVTLEKDGANTYITLAKIPNDPVATAEITVQNALEDFRGYSNVTSVANLVAGEKKSVYSTLTLTAKSYNGTLLNSVEVEIYKADDLDNPLSFNLKNEQIFYASTPDEQSFSRVALGDTGYCKIFDLPDGKYIVKQVTTKEGYYPSRTYSPITIQKSEGGTDLFLYQSIKKE